jgi:CHAT domain-containing protein
LQFSSLEAATVTTLLKDWDVELVADQAATTTQVLKAMQGADLVHFSCHARHDAADVSQSALYLADGPLRARQILTHTTLGRNAVVFLAACDSGRPQAADPMDEYLTLPGAFLVAGAGTVVNSLWVVEDLSSVLLVEQFYSGLVMGRPPSASLREAKAWLRGLNARGAIKRVTALQERIGGSMRPDVRRAIEEWREAGEDRRPFGHPFEWGPFIVTGTCP